MMKLGVGDPDVLVVDTGSRRAAGIWTRSYLRVLLSGDMACAGVAGMGVLGVRLLLGIFLPSEEIALCVGLVVLWPFVLTMSGAYRQRAHGEGTDEFRAVLSGGIGLMATVAVIAYATQTLIARSFVMATVPSAIGVTLLFRYWMRKRLHRHRAVGHYLRQVIAVGHREAILDLVVQFRREPHHGMEIVGACLPPGAGEVDLEGVRVLGDFTEVAKVVREIRADAVAVLTCPELDGSELRRLAWSLEPTRTDLFVAPALLEVAGPRISIRPVAGMPLLHVEHPEFDGARQLVKGTFDKMGALLLLLLGALPLLVIAAAIKFSDHGPVFFRQVRVGRRGRRFRVIKFRTMVVDAERLKDGLLESSDVSGVLFKMRNDPRITKVGGVLRRYSLDELPQLLNVLRGEMSLVGPRPPLPEEVAKYGIDVRRRLVVKPGMTGLWQVSGRSNLTWEESVRLDLRYVENWSLILDLQILWKTWAAVTRGEGAY